MSVDEERRNRLHNSLGDLLGVEDAGTLMEMLPRHASGELATRDDVMATATVLRGEMAELRAELKGEMGDLRVELKGEMGDLRAELKGEMAEFRGRMDTFEAELAAVRTQVSGLRAEIHSEMGLMESRILAEFTAKTHQMFVGMFASVAGVAGIVIGAANLGIAG